eukprot:CAMPEP_0174850822 /NCGR_PEP_ID=MMETSP1114-20130205/21156_1 /TAXON_ID=312471 /ORGANISM="Neobodo designis, Strain CCAP 1951/1" /LENGTH=770 /DNA_ID=CAMNT_0016085309 /DNA_START=167 /DNA_END=2479 /DNA_ORIENTATION=-
MSSTNLFVLAVLLTAAAAGTAEALDLIHVDENTTTWQYRLVGGTGPDRGLLLVRPAPANTTDSPWWGGVCADGFTAPDARVACRSLGFADAVAQFPLAHHGRSSPRDTNESEAVPFGATPSSGIPARLDHVACNGREDTLSECLAARWDRVSCGTDGGSTTFISLHCHGTAPVRRTPGGGTNELRTPRQILAAVTAAALAAVAAPFTAMALQTTATVAVSRCAPCNGFADDVGARAMIAPAEVLTEDADLGALWFVAAIALAAFCLNLLLCGCCVAAAASENAEDAAMMPADADTVRSAGKAHRAPSALGNERPMSAMSRPTTGMSHRAGDASTLTRSRSGLVDPSAAESTDGAAGLDYRGRSRLSTLDLAGAKSRFPSVWLAAALWAYQGVAYLSAQLLTRDDATPEQWLFGAFGVLFCLLTLAYVYIVGAALARDPAASDRAFVAYSEYFGDACCSCSAFVLPSGFWHGKLERSVHRHAVLLDSFGVRAQPYAVGWALIRALFAAAVASAVPTGDDVFGCLRVSVVGACGFGVMTLVYLIVRPQRSPLDNISQVVSTACAALLCLHNAAAVLEDHAPDHRWLRRSATARDHATPHTLFLVALGTAIAAFGYWCVLFVAECFLRPLAMRAKTQRLAEQEADRDVPLDFGGGFSPIEAGSRLRSNVGDGMYSDDERCDEDYDQPRDHDASVPPLRLHGVRGSRPASATARAGAPPRSMSSRPSSRAAPPQNPLAAPPPDGYGSAHYDDDDDGAAAASTSDPNTPPAAATA